MCDPFVFGGGRALLLDRGRLLRDWAWARGGRINNYDGPAWTLATPDRGYLIFDRALALEVKYDFEAW